MLYNLYRPTITQHTGIVVFLILPIYTTLV